MDYNNLESTSYPDIAAAFERTAMRLQARKVCTGPQSPAWSGIKQIPPATFADTSGTDPFRVFWNEPILHTVRKETYRLNVLVGTLTSGGMVPREWVAASTMVTRRTWKHLEFVGADVRGQLPNGNHWRYFGQCGEVFAYHDVPSEAAAYFDRIVDGAFFRTGH